MANGLIKNTSVIGIMKEVTEGTYVAPAAATDYLAPLQSGFELVPSRDLLQRNILTSSIARATPKTGIKAVKGSLPVEFRASGTEGADVDFANLLESALGAKRSIATTTTTKSSGNSGSSLKIDDADISKFTVGDIICVKETGAHHVAAVTGVTTTMGSAAIAISPAKPSGSFSNSVVISKSQMYYSANSGHPSLSLSYYWGNQILEKAIGCKVTSLALDNYQTGQLAALNFGLEGLDFDQVDGAAPHSPTFDTGTPPVILAATLYQDGTALQVNKFALSLTNKLAAVTDFGSAAGKISQRVSQREIKGTLNPYKDDTAVTNFTKFNANTEFALLVRAYIPSATAGEMTMGSIVCIYLPKCTVTSLKVGDQEGVLTDEMEFQAGGGSDGTSVDMYLGLI